LHGADLNLNARMNGTQRQLLMQTCRFCPDNCPDTPRGSKQDSHRIEFLAISFVQAEALEWIAQQLGE
jgi:hypothetical protein